MRLNAPRHVWNSVRVVGFFAALLIVSAVGMALGYPQVLWVWLLPALIGVGERECHCDACSPPKEEAADVVARRYADGELSDEELEEILGNVERIKESDEAVLEERV